jgi:soluble lytic murein transglycosylase
MFPLLSYADQEADFLAARAAFRKGNAVMLDKMAERLKNSPLEPYLAYYQLRIRWDTDLTGVKAFLARPDDSPVYDQFRVEWLKHIGSKKRWQEFSAEYEREIAGDDELTCYSLQMRLDDGDDSALQAARSMWFKGDTLPDSCVPLFNKAIKQDIITEQDILQRIRLSLEAGHTSVARLIASKLPRQTNFPTLDLGKASADPDRYLAKVNLDNSSDGQRLVAMFALLRLSKHSPQLAFRRWEKIADKFSLEEQKYFFSWLGYEASRNHDVRALAWYKLAADMALTEPQLAWRVRAALREQNWQEVLTSIDNMPYSQQKETAWRYWKARALSELNLSVEAEEILLELSHDYSYYGQLAAEELGAGPAAGIVTVSYQPAPAEIEAVESMRAVQRTLMLYQMDMRVEASKEWAWALRGFDDRQLLIASEVAQRNNMYDRSIMAAERTQQMHDFNLRYPAPYRDVLQSRLREHGLEEAWVYGLMRQESRFATHARSDVGAAGLMQIMPATARWVAKRLGMRDYRKALLHQMDVNLKLGTYYMKNVLSSLDNNPVLASAAYNAGPSRARDWRADGPLEAAIYIETIPFDETRDYVRKVMSNTVYYAKLFGQSTFTLKQRMGVIAGKNDKKRAGTDGQ